MKQQHKLIPVVVIAAALGLMEPITTRRPHLLPIIEARVPFQSDASHLEVGGRFEQTAEGNKVFIPGGPLMINVFDWGKGTDVLSIEVRPQLSDSGAGTDEVSVLKF